MPKTNNALISNTLINNAQDPNTKNENPRIKYLIR